MKEKLCQALSILSHPIREVVLDMRDWQIVSRKMNQKAWEGGVPTKAVIKMGFVAEGRSEATLPEQMIFVSQRL